MHPQQQLSDFGTRPSGVSRTVPRRIPTPFAILAATFLAYVDTLALGFVFDDHVLIVTNDSIRSWRYLPTYFTSHIWSFRYPHLLANYYRPLFLIWLRLNDAVFGLRPWGWHLTSMLAHLAVTYLVYRLALRLAPNRWAATAAGLAFGLLPVHAEAVADITSIQEPLSTFFILAALLAFCRSREAASGSREWAMVSLVSAAAALLSKESGMMVPVIIAGYLWVFGEPSAEEADSGFHSRRLLARLRDSVVAALPYGLVVLLYLPARIHALKGFAHMVTPLPLGEEILTIPSALVFYLRLIFWPAGLSCYYDTPYVTAPGWRNFTLPMVLLLALAAGVLYGYRHERRRAPEIAKLIAFASLWVAVTLVPVLNFRFLPPGEIAHDRYVYLPSVGIVLLLAAALARLGTLRAGSMPRLAIASVAILVFGGMGYATARQCLFWSDDLTLNYRAHMIAPNNVSATTSLAAAVAQRGMDASAMALYRQALAVQVNFWRANVNLAYLEYAHGNYPEAAQHFARACDADPTDGDQFLYLGMSLLRLGRAAEAERAVRTALLIRPEGKNYHLGLGIVLKSEGKLDEAKQQITAQLAIDPRNVQAANLLKEIESARAQDPAGGTK